MTDEHFWRPVADPNAETKATWTRPGPGSRMPQQRAAGLDATRVMGDAGIPGIPGGWADHDGTDERDGPGRGVSRRRVLFAAGGLMLLAGGGAAVAAAVGSGKRPGSGTSLAGGTHGTHTATPSQSTASQSTTPAAPSTTPHPTSTDSVVATQPQWYVDDQGPMAIALTMDDGPNPTYTPQVLEVLRRHNIKATFNMIGLQVAANLSLVREVSAEGHTITNHTWNHANLARYSFNGVCSQIDRCNEALANANQNPTIFRAPFGNWSPAVFRACAARDLRPVGWSVDPRDWDTTHVDTYDIVQNVMRHTHAHDIILEHDGGGDRRNTVAALDVFIPRLLAKGFNFVAM